MFFIPSSHLPDEILLMIFSESDISTLLTLSNVCKKFRRLANICLVNKFKEQKVSITLTFGQEHRLRSRITMKFHHVNKINGNFVFQPKEDNLQLKFYHSAMIKSPKIYRATLNNVVQEDNETTKQPNLLQKSIGLPIKAKEGIYQKIPNVYRIGNGSSHLKVPFTFTYSIINIPPPDETISRGGERWITPLSFECPSSFFYPNDGIAHRILKSMINYKKQKTTIVSDTKQKQRMSFSQESQIQEPILQQVPQIEMMHEKKKLFKIPLVSSKWNRGARC